MFTSYMYEMSLFLGHTKMLIVKDGYNLNNNYFISLQFS